MGVLAAVVGGQMRVGYLYLVQWVLLAAGCARESPVPYPGPVTVSYVGKAEILTSQCDADGSLQIPLEIKNNLDQSVHLSVLHTSCECLGVDLGEGTIPPLGSISCIALKRAPLRPGKTFPKFIFEVDVSDGKPLKVMHKCSLELLDPTEVVPPYLFYEFSDGENSSVVKLVITTRKLERQGGVAPVFNDLPPEIRLIECSQKHVHRRPSGIMDQSWTASFRLSLSDRVDAGLVGRFGIQLGQELLHVNHNISLNVGIKISPAELVFDCVDQGEYGKRAIRRVVLRARDSEIFSIVSCSITGNGWETRPITEGEKLVHLVEVSAPLTLEESVDKQASLNIVTTHSRSCEIDINVTQR